MKTITEGAAKTQGNTPTLDNPIIIDNDLKPVLYMIIDEIKKLKNIGVRSRLDQNYKDKFDCSLTVNRAILEVIQDLKKSVQGGGLTSGEVYGKILQYETEATEAIRQIRKSVT